MPERSPLRVRIICHDLGRGGAARATGRLIEALQPRQEDLDLKVSVRIADGPSPAHVPDQSLPGGAARPIRFASHFLRNRLDRLPSSTADAGLRSRGDAWTGLGRETNRTPLDVVNLHWVGTGTLSIGEIGRLRHPIVMTLHDMWAFSGSEHYSDGARYRYGYSKASRPAMETGIDWDRLTWLRKQRNWRRPMHIIAPSNWIAECARSSSLMAEWPITVIPHAIDTEVWAPLDRGVARAATGLPTDATLLLVGADGGITNRVKGGDLLEEALHRLPKHLSSDASAHRDIRLVTFGSTERRSEPAGRLPFPVEHLGNVEDDFFLRAIYSACNVMVVPSRLEAFGLVALEAQACGVPVVAFAVGGPADIVEDGVTGRLATAFDTDELANAIAWVTLDPERTRTLGATGRALAKQRFSPRTIATDYAALCRTVSGHAQ